MNSTAGEMIRNARKQAGLTQKQLSEKYAIPLSSLKDWELSKHNCPDYVANLLLRCLAIDFPTEQSLFEKQPVIESAPEPVKKPTYTLHTDWGKRLTPEQAAEVEKEIAGDRVSLVSVDESGWKQYVCKLNKVDFDFVMRPTKEA
jgi:transcriptional regulator with XRE-family HTH domain